MAVTDQAQFEHTAVNGAVVCQNCMNDGRTYSYQNGQIHSKVVLCHDCVQVRRLRDGNESLRLVDQ